MSTHLGTHLDAPKHFFDNALTVDKLDLGKVFGPARVLDFSDKGAGSQITLAELESISDKITEGARLIIHTGWDKVFPDDRYFSECPAIVPDACEYLAKKKIACLALDMPTVCGGDYVAAHRHLLNAEVVVVEGLANLDKLQSEIVLFSALPLKIRDCDGSPCRAIAIDGMSNAELAIFNAIIG